MMAMKDWFKSNPKTPEEMYGLPPGKDYDDEDEGEAKNKQPDAEAKIAALEAKIAAMEREARMANFMAQPQQRQETQLKEPQPVSLDGLPDQYSDPEGYAKALNERIAQSVEQRMSYHQHRQQRETEDSQRYQQLWTDFTSRDQYKDLADKQEQVEFAARKVAAQMAARGVDVERYMFGARDQFFEDVHQEYERIFSGGDNKEKGEANRTEGISGGYEGGAPQSGAPQPQSNMMKEMADLQKEAGIFI